MPTAGSSGALVLRLVAFWDRLRASPGLKGAFLFGTVAALLITSAIVPNPEEAPLADAERFAFDQQMRLLRQVHPRTLPDDIVLIGTNEDTYRVFDEPFEIGRAHV